MDINILLVEDDPFLQDGLGELLLRGCCVKVIKHLSLVRANKRRNIFNAISIA